MKYVKAKSRTLTNEVQQLKHENKCEFCQNFFYSKNLLKTHMKREHEQNLRHELFNIKKNLMEKKMRLEKRILHLNMEIIVFLLSDL